MEYTDILEAIEKQKEAEGLSAKLFRYSGLLQAIEFFSQKLNFDQIEDAAFDFSNELLTLEKSAIFVLRGNKFVLKKLKGLEKAAEYIDNTKELENIALFHGTLMYGKDILLKYFSAEIIDAYKVTISVPLIIENYLYGFIFISSKTIGEMQDDDYIILEALMKLFNNALENYKRYEELQKANRELDEKIFNLFAINQSTKALLSELNLEMLYKLSVDVFAELTQSSSTGFILFDDKSEKFMLKAFKDINFKKMPYNLAFTRNKSAVVNSSRVILNLADKNDSEYLSSLFMEGLEVLEPITPEYLVMLLKQGELMGFVSLGKTVTCAGYKSSILELVESLASSTYLAITNAMYFDQVKKQKQIIQNKLEKLISLNNLTRNINNSNDLETLLDLTLKTLDISFDVDKALITIYDSKSAAFKISNKLNIETKKRMIKPTDSWKRIFEGDSIYDSSENAINKYFDKQLRSDIGEYQGILIIPIYMDKIEIEMLGAIIVLKYENTPIGDEESLLTLETIASHIAPVLSNLKAMESLTQRLVTNYEASFKTDLKREIEEAIEYDLNLTVVQFVNKQMTLFADETKTAAIRKSFKNAYPFTNNSTFVIWGGSEKELVSKLNKLSINDVDIRIWMLRRNFNSYNDFINLF